jgi:hypothetical protein
MRILSSPVAGMIDSRAGKVKEAPALSDRHAKE